MQRVLKLVSFILGWGLFLAVIASIWIGLIGLYVQGRWIIATISIPFVIIATVMLSDGMLEDSSESECDAFRLPGERGY